MNIDEYRALFDSSPHPMWVFDEETGSFLDVNQAAIQVYGYSREEFLGLAVDDIYPSGLSAVTVAPRREDGSAATFGVSRHRRRDGSQFFAETAGNTLRFSARKAFVVTAVDVTTRVEAEQRTHESETKFRAFFEMSPDASGLARNGEHVLVNPAYAEMFGYDSPDALVGRPLMDVFAASERSRLHEFMQLRESGGAPETYQARGLRRNGSEFEIDVRVSQFTESGELYSVFVLRDVSPLLRANEALEQNRRRLAEAQRIASLGNWELDLPNEGLIWSEEIYRIFGLDPGRFAPSRELFYECVHEDDRPLVRDAVNRAVHGLDRYGIDHRIVRPDGEVRWVHEEAEVLSGTAGRRLVGTVQDITARHMAEEMLRLLRTVVVSTPDPVIICAAVPPHPVVFANPAFSTGYGYEPAEILGQSPELLLGSKTDRAAADRVWQEAYAGRHGSLELTHYRKDGSDYVAEVGYRGITDNGRLTHVVLVARDVTERKRLEAQFRQSQKMEAVGRLAGGVAHDFNNLLLIIAGYAHMLRDGFPTSDPRMEAIEQISKAADRAAALTRQLLLFSRRQDLRRQVVDVNQIVTNIEKMLRRVIGEDVELITQLTEKEALVRADPNQFDQVLMNLAVNARDAMPDGGALTIRVDLPPVDGAVEAHYGLTGSMVRIAISDTGIGMDPETQSRIFEPFFTTKAEGAGTGLGLSTVYAIVKQNDGEIFVYSAVGEGTTFEIVLPLAAAEERPPAPAAQSTSPGGTETILLAEDDTGVRKLIAAMLRRAGYTVIEAALPEQALEIVKRTSTIQLLLTDIVMPGMTGWNLAKAALAWSPGLKVVYMSGYTDHAAIEAGEAAAVTMLRKPFTMDVLLNAVREALGVRRVGRPS